MRASRSPPKEPNVPSTHEQGRRFEALAVRHLTGEGWTVLERNVRFGHKEVDLVVRRGQTVAFVEVKGRLGRGYGHPLEAITARKRREIGTVARWWVSRHGHPDDEYRFDAVAIVAGADGLRIEHLEDAWRMDGG